MGRFDEAVQYFKAAVRAKPRDVDAKINLELAIKKQRSDAEPAEKSPTNQETRDDPLSAGTADILQQVQKEEESVWKEITAQETAAHMEDW